MTASGDPLQPWLDRLRAGDPAARNELIRHSRERLRLLTRQMLRRFPGVRAWEETSDVLQNVLVRLDRALQAVEVPSPRDFLRLANTQIRRELIDLARHYRGRQGPVPDMMPPDPPDKSNDPDRLALWHEFHCLIADLGEEDRELFELLYYQGLKQADAALFLGVPLTTLKRRWRAARLRLMTRLGGKLPF